MIGSREALKRHRDQWARFHAWEKTWTLESGGLDPTARLRWCEEALALLQRNEVGAGSTIEAEQIQQWQRIRQGLPRGSP